MSNLPTLSGPIREPAAGGTARQLVVLLHGLGADGNDLIGLADEWSSGLPHAAFVAPNGTEPFDMAPTGHQWFSLQSLDPDSMLVGVRAAAITVGGFLDAELARRGLDESGLALVGFSQGAALALYVALRREPSCAAVISYSGFLVALELLADDIRARPTVLLVHGDADEVVQVGAMAEARSALAAVDVPVECVTRPGLGHGIDAAGVGTGAAHLRRAFGSTTVRRSD